MKTLKNLFKLFVVYPTIAIIGIMILMSVFGSEATTSTKVKYDGLTNSDFRNTCGTTLTNSLLVAEFSRLRIDQVQYVVVDNTHHWYLEHTVESVNGLGMKVVKGWDCVSVEGRQVEVVVQ